MKYILRFLIFVLLIAILAIFPFIALIRGAVYIHEIYEWMPWAALLGGVGITTILLMIYFTFIYGRLTGRIGNKGWLKRRFWMAMVVVLLFAGQGVFYLSAGNMKSEALRAEYTQLHPILRLGISTLVMVDKGVIITDASRVPEDYTRMGLPKKNNSLHYRQSDGFAYAVDLRTKGRSEYHNQLVQWYFKMMGFNTLRHGGTGDHLHISLSNRDYPGAI